MSLDAAGMDLTCPRCGTSWHGWTRDYCPGCGLNHEGKAGTMDDLQMDIASVVMRLRQVRDEGYEGHWLMDRLVTCDLPRLERLLTPASLADLEEFSQEVLGCGWRPSPSCGHAAAVPGQRPGATPPA